MNDHSVFQGLRVLLVEDNKINQMLIKKMIENLGCEVLIASSGLEALQVLESQIPALVLTDIQMPDMNGIELAERIQHHPISSISKIPVVAITGYAGEDEKNAALSSGIRNILLKPFSQDDLGLIMSQSLGINPDKP